MQIKTARSTTPHLLKWQMSRTPTASDTGEDAGQLEVSFAVGTMLLWRTTQRFCDKLNLLVPYDPAIMLLGVYPKEANAYINTKTSIQCL